MIVYGNGGRDMNPFPHTRWELLQIILEKCPDLLDGASLVGEPALYRQWLKYYCFSKN